MDRNRITLILLICLLLALFLWLLEPTGNPAGQETDTTLLKKLQLENDSLRINNKQLKMETEALESFSDSLLVLVNTDKQLINRLKNATHENLKAIDNFNNDELLRFFTEFETDSQSFGHRHRILLYHPTE